jgi:hypothetical protein
MFASVEKRLGSPHAGVDSEPPNRSTIDHYKCPAEMVRVDMWGRLLEKTGFFRFGADSVCYGQCSAFLPADHPNGSLYDALDHLRFEPDCVALPFHASRVASALRNEEYIRLQDGRSPFCFGPVARASYYAVRPFLPVGLRRHLQRFALRDWRERVFPHWPVDTTVEQLHESVMTLALQLGDGNGIPFIWYWPEGAPGCAIVTHDVETTNGRNYSDGLMDIDDAFGIKSSFQLVPEERYQVTDEYLDHIRQRGFELNVQDLNHGGLLYHSKEEFLPRAKEINRYVREFGAQGFRAAVLYRNPEWYHALGVSYDMSVPNVAHLDPQRGGCCTVFPYFIGNILELPVTLTQDYTLFHILRDYSISLWKEQIGLILGRNGLISVVVHPDYIIPSKAKQTYYDLLGYLAQLRREQRVWICLPRDANAWWRARQNMRLVNKTGKWQIEGEGSERARVAYVRLKGDQVVYTVEGEQGDSRTHSALAVL